MECLICGETINSSRLGVNACRACAAFYKRAEDQWDRLVCANRSNKCYERSRKTNCRRCRMARFTEVLAQASQEVSSIEVRTPNNHVEENGEIEERWSSFIDHTSFNVDEATSSKTPWMDRIRKAYSLMCVIRLSGEHALLLHAENKVVKENVVLYPTSYSSIIPLFRLTREAFIEFANIAFPDFKRLDRPSKDLLLDRNLMFLDLLESTYRAYHYFPKDHETRMVGYTTYLSITDLEKLFDNCPDDIDKNNLISEFEKALSQLADVLRHQFESTNPAPIEFLALVGLAFWKEEFVDHDEALHAIAVRIRLEIMSELNAHYKASGMVDYAARVGELFCLLMNGMSGSEKVLEDFQIFRLLKIFDAEEKLFL